MYFFLVKLVFIFFVKKRPPFRNPDGHFCFQRSRPCFVSVTFIDAKLEVLTAVLTKFQISWLQLAANTSETSVTSYILSGRYSPENFEHSLIGHTTSLSLSFG